MTRALTLCLLLAATASHAADVSSLIFYDYTHDATEGGTADGAFNMARGYVTVTGAPSENVSYKLQVDAGMLKSYTLKDAGIGDFVDVDGDTLGVKSYSLSGSDAGFFMYLKNACIDLNTSYGKWTIGMQGMNLFNVQEATFGNRFLEKPLMDTRGFSSSADLGLGYSREFGLVKTSVLYTNGSGYKKAETDKYKKLSVQVAAGETALSKKDGWNAGIVYSMEPTSADYSTSVMGLFGGWAGAGLRAGFEYDTRTVGAATDVTSTILGFYGDYKLAFAPGVALFGSMDIYDPNTDADADNNETTVLAGVKWAPYKGVVIAPNLRSTTFENSDVKAKTYYRISLEFKV